ncbi:hypothetical protein A2477_00120 [Candidatus Falkowbacteria bacterium RIFOXYC2_FULL_47_12]|uniref:DUF2304 domain-containing protein n=2 Tax=Candidatus Falkowiibacteriota TaxID=1752728 RepID=A0A1F5TRA2_9BACT|nr:MAG: hypothetical protein A2242_00495 [Candidatus Falkowbacteria bacterium RIFOXYA2_FULL_47_9]OGF41453.1 MAG: hypothetical protein A2477_00120 [Candidatus Falkowbacteria bacterium RIFOXYC2_FULL_47_12]
MYIQQAIALVIIVFFIIRLFKQRRDKNVNQQEFGFWLVFWVCAGLAIIALPYIDAWLSRLGFSSSGIEFLLYLAVAVLFYFIFRLRLHIARLEKDLTTIVRELALREKK